MHDIEVVAKKLDVEIAAALEKLQFNDLQHEETQLKALSQSADFWQDTGKAQNVMKRLGALEARLQPWRQLRDEMRDVLELIKTGDSSLQVELDRQISDLQNRLEAQKDELKLSGIFDDHDAILSIHAGAGGTDAQDWALMLQRMYTRWAEKQRYKVQLIEESPGEEAGIKSVTLAIDGAFAYGKLQGEHGVHRLVRLSPFNADNLRQTSFAKVEVLPKIDQPADIAIDEKDLKIDVYRSGGHGGQSVNTTDSAVRVTHIPTGIVVAIQNERSQLQNKETALTILRSKLAQLQLEQHQDNLRELKGPNEQAAWGNQIRSYVLHPYKQVKDLRTRHESSDPDTVLDGDLNAFIEAYLDHHMGS